MSSTLEASKPYFNSTHCQTGKKVSCCWLQEFVEHGSDVEKIYRICKDIANVMNALYSPLNIYIALVGVVVWTEYDEISLSTNGDTTLTNFLHYRRERLVKLHPNDNAQLLTGVTFEGGVVGKALKGPICTYEFSGGVNMWHSDVVGLIATTVAHEMGHNFGMEHDTEACECPDDKCIMAPASSTMKPSFWSSCSLEYLALAFEHGMDYCLRNKPVALFDGPVCGNGFVEPGEACDCGLEDHCDNPCCDPNTCKLYSNATCGTGDCCDFTTCRPKSPGTTCRAADHECDLPEFCNGESEFCPDDVFKVDGTSCKVGKAFCYRGACRTHSDQCKLLWGPSGKKSDNQCYEQNRKGTRHGNCGYNRINNSYIQCLDEDVRCGMLHCSHLNERLEFGMESVAILSHSFINSGGRIIPCRTALVDLGINDVDPGLAPEGAKCDEGKLCVDRKCIAIENLEIGPNACPDNCNGRGECNSLGHCHCQEGYAPPDCLNPGAGGSIDSGPACETDQSSLYAVLYVILFIFFIVFICSIVFYVRKRRAEDWKMLAEKARFRGFLSSTASTPTEEKSGKPSSIEISAPLAVGEISSSPSQALLPQNEVNSKDFASKKSRSASTDLAGGRSVMSSLGSWASGFSRTSRKSSTSETTTTTTKEEKTGGSRKSFVQSLAKSITFPSPRLRLASGKQRGNTPAKYEITVEHREPNEDIASPIEETPLTPDKPEAEVVTSPVTSPTSPDKVETTVRMSPTGPTVSASKSFTARPYRGTLQGTKSFGAADDKAASNKEEDEDKVDETSALMSKPAEEKKPTFTQSASFSYIRPNTNFAAVPSSRSLSFAKKPSLPPNKPLVFTNKLSEASKVEANDKLLNPKSEPESSNVSKVTSPTSTEATVTTKSKPIISAPILATTTTAKSTTAATAMYTTSAISATTTTAGAKTTTVDTSTRTTTFTSAPTPTATTKAATLPVKSSLFSVPFTTTAATKTTVISPTTTAPTPSLMTTSTSTFKPTTSTATSSTLFSSVLTTKPSVSALNAATTDTTDSKPSTVTTPKASMATPEPLFKTSLTKTSTLPSSLSTAGEPLKMPKSSTLPTVQLGRPVISRPILQAATSSAASLILKAPSTGVSQSSILAGNSSKVDRPLKDRTSRGVVFCDPITLPSPTNPNTPPIIHQPPTSGSTSPSTTTASAEIMRGATAPAVATSTASKPTQPVTTVITPTWSVVAPPKPDAVICHIDDSDAGSEVPSSPEHSESKSLSGLSKLKSKLKRDKKPKEQGSLSPTSSVRSLEAPPRPERGRLRSLEISGPILQSTVDSKLNLVPVCRSNDVVEPLPAIAESKQEAAVLKDTGAKVKAKAPQPPALIKPLTLLKDEVKPSSPVSWRSKDKPDQSVVAAPESSNSSPTKSSRRPASIATTRPSRPTSRPPQPPPPRPLGSEATNPKEPLYDTVRESSNERDFTEKPKQQPPPPPPRPKSLISGPTKAKPEHFESPFTSPQEFVTPTSSPLFSRKSPDTVSTASSSEGDLLREILNEMAPTDGGGDDDSIYSTLMRKKKKKNGQREKKGGE